MTRPKLALLGLCAVLLAMLTVSAGSAQAALSWLVLNSAGTTATELKAEQIGEIDSADLTLLKKILGVRGAITCTSFQLLGAFIDTPGVIDPGFKAKFAGCEAYGKGILEEPLNCHVHSAGQASGVIVTNELKGELVLHEIKPGEKEVLAKIEPKTGTVIVTILTEKCILPETITVSGKVFIKDCEKKATTHEVKHLIEQGPLTSLWVSSDTAEHLETSLDGSAWVKLGGPHVGLKWAAMDA